MQLEKVINRLAALFAYLAGILYVWSIAATNGLLAMTGLLTLANGSYFKSMQKLRRLDSLLFFATVAYLAIVALGILWSSDPAEGLLRLTRKWIWFVIPAIFSVCLVRQTRSRFILALTSGLFLNLLFCLFQYTQWIPFGRVLFDGAILLPAASTPEDPTGMLDHIVFGAVYGAWSAWLLHLLIKRHFQSKRIDAFIATFIITSWVFIFMADGRAGWLCTLATIAAVVWKDFKIPGTAKLLFIMLTPVVVVLLAPQAVEERVQFTADSLSRFVEGHPEQGEPRIMMWAAALKIWEQSPIFGTGTGSYNKEVQKLVESDHAYHRAAEHDHPHQLFLWHLVTNGIVGLIVSIILVIAWIRLGFRQWHQGGASLAISGLVILVHGMTEETLEQHFPLFMMIFMLAIGMSMIASHQSSETP